MQITDAAIYVISAAVVGLLVTLLVASILVVAISFVRRRGSWSAQRRGSQGR
jgi:hypothetical protein